jgi:hypothetical protein
MDPIQYQPLVTTKSHHEHLITANKLDDSDNLREYILTKTASHSSEDHLSNPHFQPTQYHPVNNRGMESQTKHIFDRPNQRIKPTENTQPVSFLPLEQEVEFEDDEDYNCCCDHHHSTPRFCNEGTKNLCTLAIWAIIILVFVNRFLMHMSMYLHGRVGAVAVGSVEIKNDPMVTAAGVDGD